MDSFTSLTLTKDPEFERLASCRIQSLSDRELCLAFKNNPPLIAVWQGTVLLSYRELMLCRLYNIPYEIDPRPFFCRQEAIVYIFNELEGDEGLLVASKIADRVGITRSVIVNALRKFESAGVIESRSSGMKGTYIKVINDAVFDELRRLQDEQ